MIKSFSILEDSFIRADKVLSDILKVSRREVNFLFKNKKIKINSRYYPKSKVLKKGDLVEIIRDDVINTYFDYSKIKVVFQNKNLLLIYKPPFFHSAKIKKNIYSVEHFIELNFKNYNLLNRLDYMTEGLLICGNSKEFCKKFKNLFVEKYYIGILKGILKEKILIDKKIHMNHRKKVKVLNLEHNTNKTFLEPIGIYKNFTVANIIIYKGARHQIRAHCSYINYPLLGDTFYGEQYQIDRYFLFCYGYKIKELGFEFFAYNLLKKSLREWIKKVNFCSKVL